MTTIPKIARNALSIILFLGMAGCSNIPAQNTNTTTDTAKSATGGTANTGGSTTGTVGNAAAMGVIGHEISK